MYIVRNGSLPDNAGNMDPFIDQIPDYALYLLDTSGNVLSWNTGAQRLKGYTAQEIIGRNFSVFFAAEDLAEEKPRHALEIAAREGTYQEEAWRVRKDGTRFWATVTITALKDEEGKLQGFAKLVRDFTERKIREAALLQARETKYRALFENSRDAVFLTRPDDTILAANPAACTLFGYSEQELASMRREQLLDMTDPRLAEALTSRSETGEGAAELTFIRKDGGRFEARISSKLFTDENGQQMACTSVHDITERKQAEEALRQSEERFRLLYENAPLGIIQVDQDGYVTAANRKFAEISGYLPEEAVGIIHSDVTMPEERASFAKRVEDLFSGKIDTLKIERRLVRKDQSTIWVRETAKLTRDKQDKPQWGIVVFEDITERKQTEEALRQSEERFRLLYESAPIGITHFDLNGICTFANQKLPEIIGYPVEEVVGLSYLDVTPLEDRDSAIDLMQKLISGEIETSNRERQVLRKDGSTLWVRQTAGVMHDKLGKPQFGIAIFEDINERKEAEEALRQSEERFRVLYENAPLGIVQFDQFGGVTSANKKFTEISGYSPEEVIGLVPDNVTLPEDKVYIAELAKKLLSGELDASKHERRMTRKDGSTIWVRANIRMMSIKPGKPRQGIVLYEDITERKQAEDSLRQSEEKFRATFEHAPLGIAEGTVDGRIIEVNSKLAEILGYAKDEIEHLTLADVTHPGDTEETLSNLRKLAAGEIDSYVIEKRYIRKDRSFVWVNVQASIAAIHGKPQNVIVTIEDITERKKVEEDLKRAMESSYYQANHDMLTGLANRAAFTDRLKEALAYAKRDGHLVAVHLLDLDGFKSINDTLGHHVGDLLLKDVAKRIKSHVRATDLAARLGGDEFVVIQTHLTEPDAAGVLAGKLLEDLGRTYFLEDQEVHSGASIGIAVYPDDAEAPEELVKHADLALYDAKHRGRFNYQFYRKELGDSFQEAQRLEQELVRALRENEFCLHYQPQFDLKNRRITGIEALLRWQHPTRGTLLAADFVLDAERARLMLPIGEWVLQAACRQYKEWFDTGLAVPLTLNLSSMQLRDPRFLQTLMRILEETGLPASMLQLSMHENALWDPKFSKTLLTQMKESGLRLALDDFGVEMTALSTLDRFPLDAVKPGRGLVKELPSQKREATILKAIIEVAHNLKIAVCADGVENAEQLAAVTEKGCDSAQGYLLSSPLNRKEMTRLIEVELVH